MIRKLLLCILLPVLATLPLASAAAAEGSKQPVYIMLYTRIDDHTQLSLAGERIQRLLPVLERFRKQYPEHKISSVFLLSGAMSEALDSQTKPLGLVNKVKDFAGKGILEVGYTGEYEPQPRTWPRPDLSQAKTAEEHWVMRAGAAESFLSAYRHPIFGDGTPMAGVDNQSGGMRKMQEVFGPAIFARGLSIKLGGDSPLIHQLKVHNVKAILFGLPDPDPARGIHAYRGSVSAFGEFMSPIPETSPEVYWEDNVLRSSDTDKAEVRAFSTSEPVKTLKEAFAKLDRSRVHVLHMEYGSYVRYLQTWHDGVPRFLPLTWAYDHPYDPIIPTAVPAFTSQMEVDEAYQAEEAVLKWLVEEFFPANPGSRFVSCSDLMGMAETTLGQTVSKEELREAASSLLAGYAENGLFPANYARTGNRFFSLADMFQLLSTALGEFHRKGSLPAAVTVQPVYGPLAMEEDPGAPVGELPVSAMAGAAADIADHLNRSEWKPVPENVVPTVVTVDGVRLNPAQFLRLMAEAYLAPVPQTKLKIQMSNNFSPAGEMFPRQIMRVDQGNTWTFKPAPLRVPTSDQPQR